MVEVPVFTEKQKVYYFAGLGMSTRDAFRQHIAEGLWRHINGADGDRKTIRDWGNVSEHCLVEVARTEVLADMMGFSDSGKRDLKTAAALHDAQKKQQKAIVLESGLSFASFDLAAEEAHKTLKNAGYSEQIVVIAGAVGHESLPNVIPLLEKNTLTEFEKAQLVMHYVDDYTVNANWANIAEVVNGIKINELDRRMSANEANERYMKLNEEGRQHFNGETAYQAQRRVGHMVEARIAQLIHESTGQVIDPLDLPELIDHEIRSRIAAARL